MRKTCLCLLLFFGGVTGSLAQKKASNPVPAGVPAPRAIASITLSCRQGKVKEVVTKSEEIDSFVYGLSGVAFWNTEKVPGPVTISIKLKRGGVVRPDTYLDGRVVFNHRHYKLAHQWLDRPLCGAGSTDNFARQVSTGLPGNEVTAIAVVSRICYGSDSAEPVYNITDKAKVAEIVKAFRGTPDMRAYGCIPPQTVYFKAADGAVRVGEGGEFGITMHDSDGATYWFSRKALSILRTHAQPCKEQLKK